eukprot:12525874-Alexandrium_andersonii.AAC.1
MAEYFTLSSGEPAAVPVLERCSDNLQWCFMSVLAHDCQQEAASGGRRSRRGPPWPGTPQRA